MLPLFTILHRAGRQAPRDESGNRQIGYLNIQRASEAKSSNKLEAVFLCLVKTHQISATMTTITSFTSHDIRFPVSAYHRHSTYRSSLLTQQRPLWTKLAPME